MNENNTTVVICCAGMGTRLGIGLPKALVSIDNKPLILHQLEMLKNFSDIRIVVGYQADKVIEVVNSFRKDITYVFNYDFENTGPAESLSRSLIGAKEYILSIGGDIIMSQKDFDALIKENEFIAYTDISSKEPCIINVKGGNILSFNNSYGNYEWQGILKVKKDKLIKKRKYIYEMIESYLPMRGVYVKSREIDTQDDYEMAINFYNNYIINKEEI